MFKAWHIRIVSVLDIFRFRCENPTGHTQSYLLRCVDSTVGKDDSENQATLEKVFDRLY